MLKQLKRRKNSNTIISYLQSLSHKTVLEIQIQDL